jgi:hypothetical protein
MYKQFTHLLPIVLVLGLTLTSPTNAELVGWWRLDEGSGTVARDSSGNGNNGTLQGNPQWTTGMLGGALQFDGDDYVNCGNQNVLNFGTGDWTVSAWIKTTQIDKGTIFAKGGDNSGGIRYTLATHEANANKLTLTVDDNTTKVQALGATVVIDGQWYHVAAMRQGTTISVYVNGVLDGTTTVSSGYNLSGTSQHDALIGAITAHDTGGLIKYYIGVIDDVRVYSQALTPDELQSVMSGGKGFPLAKGPTPPDGAVITATWASLDWTPGDFAVSHDVYVGESFEDVNVGTSSAFRGNQTSTSFIVGLGLPGDPYPGGLVPGTTYYWRVDEVNNADPNSLWKGNVWSFSLPPRTAYKPNPADGAESVALDARLSWTAGFGAKLHTVYFGDNFDDVNNATAGAMSGTTTYNLGPLKSAKVYYWRVDETDPPTKYKGQVWSFTTPGAVGKPHPANGAADAEMNAILSWTRSAAAASHQVYFGTDKEAVRKATATSPEYKGVKALGAESYDPGLLPWDSTYYWRIDEVNNTNAASPWKGPLWTFTTGKYLLVEDFEAYNDIDPPAAGSNRIFDKWIDGFGTTNNGAVVGNNLPPYTQRTNVHGGGQAMPFSYDNNRKFSEATLTLTAGKDWTREGVTSLSLWYRGAAANAAEKMYVVLNGTAVVYNNDTTLTQKTGWTEWVIPLQQFAALGVNLTNVTSITIGFGTRGNTTVAGGTGQMYFDDIRLYRP